MARRNLDDTVIRAPFAGVVTVKAAQPGEMVSPVSAGGGFTRTGIGTIVDMDSLEVQVDVAESFINRVRQGMPATVKLNAYPDSEIPAEVIAVIPTADRSKATVAVRIGLKTKDPRLVPEMGARVSFLAPQTAAAAAGPAPRSVIVPADAVMADGPDKGAVFVVSDGRLERRAVRLGPAEKTGQVLQAGVKPGEKLAVGGLDKLKDGERVRINTKPEEDKTDES
jgi:RND family efflux transporter MFP subunit